MLKSYGMAKERRKMKEIKIKADLWRLTPDWAVAGTRGSFGSCRLVFDLSPDWEGLARRVTFFPPDGDAVAVIFNGNSVRVPDEVMSLAGTASYVLDGVGEDGTVLVSARGELRIVDTAAPGGREPEVRVPSEIEQMRAEICALRREVEELKVRWS